MLTITCLINNIFKESIYINEVYIVYSINKKTFYKVSYSLICMLRVNLIDLVLIDMFINNFPSAKINVVTA